MISILELARELNTSKTTIGRKIKELNIKNGLTISDGKYYLSDEQAEQIRESLKRNKKKKVAELEAEQMGHDEAETIKILLKQLENKDKQIERLQETIKQKDEHIKSYLVLLAQAQELQKQAYELYLIASEKQHKGIFARLFGRKEVPKLTEGPQEPQKEETGEEADK